MPVSYLKPMCSNPKLFGPWSWSTANVTDRQNAIVTLFKAGKISKTVLTVNFLINLRFFTYQASISGTFTDLGFKAIMP